MGVPYSDAWDMPVDMALDMLGISPHNAKSKHKKDPPAATASKPNPPVTANAPRKLVAARRKSKTTA